MLDSTYWGSRSPTCMDDSDKTESELQILFLSLGILDMLVVFKSAWPADVPSKFCQQRPLPYLRHLKCSASHHHKHRNDVSWALKLEESHLNTTISSSRRLRKGKWLKTTGQRLLGPLPINELRTTILCSTSQRRQQALKRAVQAPNGRYSQTSWESTPAGRTVRASPQSPSPRPQSSDCNDTDTPITWMTTTCMTVTQREFLLDLIDDLLREYEEHTQHFAEPVDVVELNFPDFYHYFTVPLDLQTIKQNLDAFARDFQIGLDLMRANTI